MKNLAALLSVPVLALACGGNEPPPKAPPAAPAEPPAEAILEKHPEKAPNFAAIQISDRIREACGIAETETYFEFNSDRVAPKADKILLALANCFTQGPLAGRSMKLAGHADPRGDEEYNMVLGGRRADQVSAALAKKGLEKERMATTSRGAIEARGSDETGWAKDRRVDVMLAE
jgi:peptidoglycan-associated lipoprotein